MNPVSQGPSTPRASPRQPIGEPSALPKTFRNPIGVTAIVGLLGLILTAAASWTSLQIDHNNERRLLQVQTKQAAEVVTSAISGIQDPLQTALDVAAATHGNLKQFAHYMSAYTGPTGLFVSASLWQTSGSSATPLTSVGQPAAMAATSANAEAFVLRAVDSPTFVVDSLPDGNSPRIAYALAGSKDSTYVVYAERAIPADRRASVDSNPAFADLKYATYLGVTTSTTALETTNVDIARLPLTHNTVRATIPFGDTSLTLVTSPTGHLGGAFEAQLPLMLLVAGIALTIGASLLTGQLVRRRTDAEKDSHTIRGLYGQLDGLYGEQRTISEALQVALLPRSNPSIPNLEIASRYVAGAKGVDIGGDWYSVILVDETRFGFVVGDVSGRGVDAATIMARVRYTLRAYLLEGHSPSRALEMCAPQLDVETDGHFATVLVGVGDCTTREITIANAGHLNPLVVGPSGTAYVETAVGPPLGVEVSAYKPTTVVMEPSSMLFAFTDGLVERRGEDIDVGLQRLAQTVASSDTPLENLLTDVLATMTQDGAEDDIAILALKWRATTG